MPEPCPACGATINDEVERTTRTLLANLDEERRARLVETYHGEPPEVLCAGCFIAVVGTINQAVFR